MSIDRTAFTALVDDDGSGLTGSVWNKAAISSVILDPVDAALGGGAAACEGRLTLTSGTPVTTADVTGATSVYFTPYGGNRIALYSGSVWTVLTFTETTLSLGTVTSGKPYDVFGYDNTGTLALEKLVWTNDSTRATALVYQDGVRVKSGATTRRYLGTFYTTSTTTTEDSKAKRLLWNKSNRVPRPLIKTDATGSWTYTTATIRQANGSTANQVEVMVGEAEVLLDLALHAQVANSAGGGLILLSSIGEDSTTTTATDTIGQPGASLTANLHMNNQAVLRKMPAAGRHFYAWLEYSTATGTTTWYGASIGGGGAPSGLTGVIYG